MSTESVCPLEVFRPPAELALSEWADRYFYLSPESSAEPGRWRTFAYQREIMDAITDPTIEFISWRKSSRVGATKIMDATIGYFMHQDPCPMMLVQPTVPDAKGYSAEEIAPMLRDCEVLADLVGEQPARSGSNSLLLKTFPGGVLSLVGANSGTGFRRVSRRVVIFDEVDAYPASAGNEGDPIKLGTRRAEYYWNRKIIAASTPLIEGASRIDDLFKAGDQRRYHVPCPHCGYRDFLTFREGPERGHWMSWDGDPSTAHFICRGNGCIIEHRHKREMIEAGEWIAEAEFNGHASFHIWAAYSLSPNTTWAAIVKEFLEADTPKKLQVFINTVLGETWREVGEVPDWERLYLRRATYPIGTVPAEVEFLTAGVDVQKDRLIYEIVGWLLDKQTYTIDAGEIHGDTADGSTWLKLDELLDRSFPGSDGEREMQIAMLAIDSGYNTQTVYNWARRYPLSRVIACKGVGARTLVGTASPVDVTVRGQKLQRGYKVWPIGEGIAKTELYGWLRLPRPKEDEPFRPGYCHFPELGEEYFLQLTAEQLVPVTKPNGFTVLEWQLQAGRQNHWLDCRVLNRVAAAVMGIDRVPPPGSQGKPNAPKPKPEPSSGEEGQSDGWLANKGKRSRRRRGRGWLGKRR